jgi:MazG family protein
MADTAGAKFERLLEIMRALRAPDGCPWDREQTHASLRPFVLEETYEVLEAIEHGAAAQLNVELGDFRVEAVFRAQISDEAGDYDLGGMLDAIADTLVRRHPHVFARGPEHTGITTDQVNARWEAIKAGEREAAGSPAFPRRTTLSGVPRTLPALLRAYEIGARAAATGFDWTAPGDVLDKIEEEVAEVRHEVEAGRAGAPARVEEEMGDLLFAIANLSRKLGVEPESALRRATEKFAARFDALEERFAAQGRALGDATLDEMEAEWQRVKNTRHAE